MFIKKSIPSSERFKAAFKIIHLRFFQTIFIKVNPSAGRNESDENRGRWD